MNLCASNEVAFEYEKQFVERAFSRSSGAPLMAGNQIDLLLDYNENFTAWIDAISIASESIFIEMYIFSNNQFGQKMRDLLADRAESGVNVCLLYDWMGSYAEYFSKFFKPIIDAGGQVQAFNPPSLTKSSSLLERNHRKLIVVDQKIAFIAGLCVSSLWEGNEKQKIAPWRDTGVRLRGPLVSHALDAFIDSWSYCSRTMPEGFQKIKQEAQGNMKARIIATKPKSANLMRLDLLITNFARQSLWITDPYFISTGVYIAAIKRAARDGVDVRLLVPRSSDIPWIATVSRTLYRPLLESGIRVFEWNGSMIHAKTAVADQRWTRIGSSNLNPISWLANRELDISIEDSEFGQKMAEQFLRDLENSTEIILSGKRKSPKLSRAREKLPSQISINPYGIAKTGAVVRQAARITDALGAVVKGTRDIDISEASSFFSIGIFLLIITILFGFFPYLVVVPLVIILGILSCAVIIKSINLYRAGKRHKTENSANQNSNNIDSD